MPLNLFNVMHKQADLNNPAGGSPAGDQGTLPNNKSDMDAARYVINYCKITQLIQFVVFDKTRSLYIPIIGHNVVKTIMKSDCNQRRSFY